MCFCEIRPGYIYIYIYIYNFTHFIGKLFLLGAVAMPRGSWAVDNSRCLSYYTLISYEKNARTNNMLQLHCVARGEAQSFTATRWLLTQAYSARPRGNKHINYKVTDILGNSYYCYYYFE
jgi:hypothetical protein